MSAVSATLEKQGIKGRRNKEKEEQMSDTRQLHLSPKPVAAPEAQRLLAPRFSVGNAPPQ
jgi:hypothetical protein